MIPGPYRLFTRAYPTPEGWWWYRIWDGERWTEARRRADVMDYLIAAGLTDNQANKRLRRARERYDDFVARGGTVGRDPLDDRDVAR